MRMSGRFRALMVTIQSHTFVHRCSTLCTNSGLQLGVVASMIIPLISQVMARHTARNMSKVISLEAGALVGCGHNATCRYIMPSAIMNRLGWKSFLRCVHMLQGPLLARFCWQPTSKDCFLDFYFSLQIHVQVARYCGCAFMTHIRKGEPVAAPREGSFMVSTWKHGGKWKNLKQGWVICHSRTNLYY